MIVAAMIQFLIIIIIVIVIIAYLISFSTIFKQLSEVYFPMSSEQRGLYGDIIHSNVITAMKSVIEYAKESNIPFKVATNEANYSLPEYEFLQESYPAPKRYVIWIVEKKDILPTQQKDILYSVIDLDLPSPLSGCLFINNRGDWSQEERQVIYKWCVNLSKDAATHQILAKIRQYLHNVI